MQRTAILAILILAAICDGLIVASRSKGRIPVTRRHSNDFDGDDDDFEFEDTSGNFDDWDTLRRRRRGGRTPQQEPEAVSGGMWSTLIPQSVTKSVLAGIFVLGIGTGVTIDSAINTDPKDLSSRDAIDRAVPNALLCQQYGSSAMVMDQRVFVSFNPFNVYVTQADTKPGCVLRPSNVVSVLADRGLLDNNEIRSCKNNMNTWAFVGDLDERPQLSCVYKSLDAQNEFLSNPTIGLGEDIYDDGERRMKKTGEGTQPETAKRIKDLR